MKTNQLREMIREEIQNALKEFAPESGYNPWRVAKMNKINRGERSHRYLFTVANDREGLERIKRAKEALSPFFKFRVRGRHHDRKEVLGTAWKAGTQNDIPVEKAEYLAVYVDPK